MKKISPIAGFSRILVNVRSFFVPRSVGNGECLVIEHGDKAREVTPR
jgi:hypothetical protein